MGGRQSHPRHMPLSSTSSTCTSWTPFEPVQTTSATFAANAACLVLAVIAFNLRGLGRSASVEPAGTEHDRRPGVVRRARWHPLQGDRRSRPPSRVLQPSGTAGLAVVRRQSWLPLPDVSEAHATEGRTPMTRVEATVRSFRSPSGQDDRAGRRWHLERSRPRLRKPRGGTSLLITLRSAPREPSTGPGPAVRPRREEDPWSVWRQ